MWNIYLQIPEVNFNPTVTIKHEFGGCCISGIDMAGFELATWALGYETRQDGERPGYL